MSQLNNVIGEYRNVSLPERSFAFTNCVYLSPTDLLFSGVNCECPRVLLKNFIYNVIFSEKINNATIGLSAIQREDLAITVNEKIRVTPIVPKITSHDINVDITIEHLSRGKIIETQQIVDFFQVQSRGQIISKNQHFLINMNSNPIKIKIVDWDIGNAWNLASAESHVQIDPNTNFIVVNKVEEQKNILEQKLDNSYYFEFNNQWFEVPNVDKVLQNIRNLVITGLDKGLIRNFTDAPTRPTDKNIKNYNEFRIYLASLFWGLVDV